jgi:uncharacterized protein YecE (DUF72 family)
MNVKNVFIGTSGWSYNHWKENFYPKNLKNNKWLSYYSSAFSTVEVNTTFYHLPKNTTILNWFAQVPDHFLFSIKASRYITHQKRLLDCEESLDIFFNSIKDLKSKVGPILFQLPPSFKINKDRLIDFIDCLKDDYRYVFEFRHNSWFVDEIYDLLSKKGIGLCITDLNGALSPEKITSDFVYIRLHGPKQSYKGSYSQVKLKSWKKKIQRWSAKNSVYCYFDNEEKGYAIQDAQSLQKLLEI